MFSKTTINNNRYTIIQKHKHTPPPVLSLLSDYISNIDIKVIVVVKHSWAHIKEGRKKGRVFYSNLPCRHCSYIIKTWDNRLPCSKTSLSWHGVKIGFSWGLSIGQSNGLMLITEAVINSTVFKQELWCKRLKSDRLPYTHIGSWIFPAYYTTIDTSNNSKVCIKMKQMPVNVFLFQILWVYLTLLFSDIIPCVLNTSYKVLIPSARNCNVNSHKKEWNFCLVLVFHDIYTHSEWLIHTPKLACSPFSHW